MAKRSKGKDLIDTRQSTSTGESEVLVEQAVESAQNFTSPSEPITLSNQNEEANVVEETISTEESQEQAVNTPQTEVVKKSSGGTAISLLALLVALGVGGAGYFFGQQKFSETEQQLVTVKQQLSALEGRGTGVQGGAEIPTFDVEKAQIAKLESEQQKSLEQFTQLKQQQANYEQQINSLQTQLEKLDPTLKAEPTQWLLSDADFLLTNALRKIVIDYDIETAKSLLIEADNTLNQISDPQVIAIRTALKDDLNNLMSLNQVDQDNVMQRLAQLANLVDDMPMLDNEQLAAKESEDISDSIGDWQKNIEKSADSFLSHFIRVTDKKQVQDKAFIAPNQEIYLRENIRLRLQIAILSVPRQQNELYKQSLEAVSTWVRSYFDVQAESVKNFLKEIDDLIEQSIYIDAPTKLQSLDLLKQKLNRRSVSVEKLDLKVGKNVEQLKIEIPNEAVPETTPAEREPDTEKKGE
ncbi:HemX protein [Vespertiliibacter pulmonis]|uniref:Uroporphyrin-3 C-methyltransferase n=1 Tax=Vespertiliibacter pulmonis TaxID=1443036 RepID=A0A3N4W3D0_9PAST|nr:uroporphyrinogen-III C-methyltransferase [Vespertiliibacter pulmonis]QLB21275.1 HemX protein [Vespertiliibacter pulmonis]RPE85681.1 uroporphyrin-3 C-methyltransferase [Vespertiliibacter pulmonis]